MQEQEKKTNARQNDTWMYMVVLQQRHGRVALI